MEPHASWLDHCEGCRGDAAGGRVGLVEEVVSTSEAGHADAIVVRAGLLGRRLLLVPAEDVGEVLPRRERIVLRSGWQPSGRDFLTDLLHRLRAPAAA